MDALGGRSDPTSPTGTWTSRARSLPLPYAKRVGASLRQRDVSGREPGHPRHAPRRGTIWISPAPRSRTRCRRRSPPVNDAWIADRMRSIEASGIRKAFDLAKSMKDPINLSIGLPDFDVAEPGQGRRDRGDRAGHNAYTVTQGIPELRGKLQAAVDAEFGHADRQVLITSGTSGGLLLALCCVGQPGRRGHHLRPVLRHVRQPGRRWPAGRRCCVDTYPDFRIDPDQRRRRDHPADQVRRRQHARPTRPAWSPRPRRCRRLAELCRERGVLLISDEVYRAFCYDHPFASPADLERRRAGRRRLQQGPRHDRLAARLRPRPGAADPGDGQAPAVQLRLRPEHRPVRRGRRARPGPDRPDRRLPPQARPGRRGPGRRLRARHARRRLLRLPEGPLGHRDRVRRRGDPAQPADHPRQRLQPPRHATSASRTPSTTRRSSAGSTCSATWRGRRSRRIADQAAPPARASRATNAACSGVARPCSRVAIRPIHVLGEERLGVEPEAGKDLRADRCRRARAAPRRIGRRAARTSGLRRGRARRTTYSRTPARS